MFCAIDHCGKTPSDCRSPATSATGPSTVWPGRGARGGGEGREQKIGLAVAGEAGQADDLAFVRHELALSVCRSGAAGGPATGLRCAAALLRPSAARALSTPPIAATSFVAIEVARRVVGDHLAVAHHDDAVAGLEDLAEDVGDQHAARSPTATAPRT